MTEELDSNATPERDTDKAFVDFVALMVEESLMRYISAFAKATPRNELLPLMVLAKGTPYSQEYLSLLARMGRIEAVKQGRNWVTTQESIQNYMKSLSKNKTK